MDSYVKHLEIELFQKDLITWYEGVKRDLPWRINKNPYRILVSEIMLQQTQVATVIPYYERFMTLFPTTKELAAADEETLLKAWEGLGYYSRARNLQESSKMIEELGSFPSTKDEILKLKGVGPYTAGAVGSIAFDLAVPAVDGNVFRVISRICCIFEDITKARTRNLFENVVSKLISYEDPGAFNQGLMELGATICKPKSPKCMDCPLQRYCLAYEQGIDDLLPVKSKNGKQKLIKYVVGIIQNQYGEILIDKRQNQGLLANFYEFKNMEYNGDLEPKELLKTELNKRGYEVKEISFVGEFKHVFSHIIWEMESYYVNVDVNLGKSESIEESQSLWVKDEFLKDYPLVVAHSKIFEYKKRNL